MSDCYFVDGKLAPPTAFGKSFEGGKWGPLDNDVVQNNLDALQPADPTPEPGPGEADQPYDSRPDTSQEWSTNFTTDFADNGKTGVELFDGLLDTNFSLFTSAGKNKYAEYTSIGKTGFTKLELYASTGATGGAGKLYINDTDYTSLLTTSPKWIEIPETELQKVRLEKGAEGFDGNLYAFRADGRVLVNQSLWNISQNWSDAITGPAVGWTTGGTALSKGFDGNPDTLANANGAGGFTMTFSPNLGSGSFDVEIFFGNDQLYTQTTIDGAAPGSTENSNLIGKWTGLSSFNVLTMNANGLAANARCCFNYIKVNGAYLVNVGAQWNTDQVWSQDASGFPSSVPASNAFNGNFNTSDAAYRTYADGKGTTATITFSTPITVSDELRVWIGSGVVDPELLYVNGNKITGITYPGGEGNWVTIPGISTLSSVGVGRDNSDGYGYYTSLAGVMVDGKVLVDATAVWNTSQRWSDSVTGVDESGETITSFDRAFNGQTDSNIRGYHTYVMDWSLTNVTSLRFRPNGDGVGNTKGNYTITGTGITSTNLTTDLESLQEIQYLELTLVLSQ